MRFRASHFPFTEPSMEVDIDAAAIGKPGQWLEILGSGMVHPNVIRNCGLDPEQLSGLRLRHGPRPHRHAEIRHPRPARHVLGRPALAAALRLSPRSTCRRSPAGCRASPGAEMKFTLSWLKDHLETSASVDRARRTSCHRSGSRSRASTTRREARGLSPSRACSRPSSIPTPTSCRCARSTPAAALVEVVCGAPNARDRHDRRVRADRQLHPRHEASRSRRGRCAASSRTGMLVSERELELSDEHEGIIELPAELGGRGRPALRRGAWGSPIRSSR